MKKSGFTFVETIITIAVLTTTLLLLYSSFGKILQNEKKRLYYDDIVYLNRTINIRNFLLTQKIDIIINELHQSSYHYRNIGPTTDNLFNDTSSSVYLDDMFRNYKLEKLILISKDDINELKKCTSGNTDDICTSSIDTGISKYLKNTSIDVPCGNILVAKYTELANPEEATSKKYNFYNWVCVR